MLPPPSKKRKLDDGEEGGEGKRTRSTGDAGLNPGLKTGGKRGGPSGGPVSLRTLVEKGFLQAGRDNLSVNYKSTTFNASLEKDGSITFEGETFNSASAFSVHAKRKLTPHKQGDDGWKSCYYAGKQLDEYRRMYNEQYGNLAPKDPSQLPPRPPSAQAARGGGAAGEGSGQPKQPATSQLAPPPQRAQRNVLRTSFFGSDEETTEDEDEDEESESEDEEDQLLQVARPAARPASSLLPSPSPAAAPKPAAKGRQPASGGKAKQMGTPAGHLASSSKPPASGAKRSTGGKAAAGGKAKTPAGGKKAKQEVLVSDEMLKAAAANNIQLETDQWVQCSRCEEWRSVPNSCWPEIEASGDEDWFCEMANWDVSKYQPFKPSCKPRKKPLGRGK
jgi:hypothetical protein